MDNEQEMMYMKILKLAMAVWIGRWGPDTKARVKKRCAGRLGMTMMAMGNGTLGRHQVVVSLETRN